MSQTWEKFEDVCLVSHKFFFKKKLRSAASNSSPEDLLLPTLGHDARDDGHDSIDEDDTLEEEDSAEEGGKSLNAASVD